MKQHGSKILLLHYRFTPPDLILRFAQGIRLRPIAAYYAARTLHDTRIEHDVMFHNPNLGFTLWTTHLNLP